MADTLSVLIVDDSRGMLAQLERLIAEVDGVEVVGTATDGAGAIQRVAELAPDLVLMDIVMPGIDGLSALRILRDQNSNLRVVMVSSVGGSGSRAEEAFRLGALEVIGKPFDLPVLTALFERELLQRQGEETS
jgi:two-component system chemotaxis response regulator CheB